VIELIRHIVLKGKVATFFLFVILSLSSFDSRADHLAGADITWVCQGGGDFVFKLRVIRDCNGAAISSVSETIQVWNHSTVSNITVNYLTDYEGSPTCAISGGNLPILCAVGGTGSFQIYEYVSNPINIGGVPPAAGWIFTWDDFNRSPASSNLNSPNSFGMTAISKMFSNGGSNTNPCYDSSPQFSSEIDVLFCDGPNKFHLRTTDPDGDSLVYSFANPMSHMTAVPPVFANPATIPYAAGYSLGSPLPSAAQNAGNVPASLDATTGQMSFTSLTQGVFSVMVKVESFRCGVKLAENNCELPITVFPCAFVNNEPTISPLLPTSSGPFVFYDTVYAGQMVNFNVVASDIELLQDGITPQQNTLTATGSQFGTNYTDPNSGCGNPPCATMSSSLPVSGSQGVNESFSWQTDCAHVIDPSCSNHTTYDFHFKVQDDVCPVPKYTTATVKVTVMIQPDLGSPELRCADVQPDGSVNLTWEPIVDPTNSFVEYRIYSSNGGGYVLEGVEANIAVGTFSHAAADAQNGSRSYIVRTISGCTPSEALPVDTLSTMYLSVSNPGNGTAILTWNDLASPVLPSMGLYYYIYQEYPLGTWTLIDSILVSGPNFWIDTIAVCNDTLTYLLQAQDDIPCVSKSSFDGGIFQDQIPPDPPVIVSVSVDTTTNQALITWEPNSQEDTYGHIIFQQDAFGNWFIVDTIYGYNNNSYFNLLSNAGSGSEVYGVAAFDSCASGIPASPNTSPIGVEHNSIFLQATLDICARSIDLNWNNYINWSDNVMSYELYVSVNGAAPSLLSSLPAGDLSYTHAGLTTNSNYCYLIKAISVVGKEALSNKRCLTVVQPSAPAYLYTQAASVEIQNQVELRVLIDPLANLNSMEVERSDTPGGPWDMIGSFTPAGGAPEYYYDNTALTGEQAYYYKLTAIDSCDRPVMETQESKTIFLSVTPDQARLVNLVQWSDYEGYDGAILGYNVYRGVNNVFNPTPIAFVGIGPRFYEDNVESYVGSTADGEFCYYVEAVENVNSYGINELAKSNVACAVEIPLIFVPNAFMLGGANPTFKPVTSFIDISEYEFTIYNRWNKLVFETDDVFDSWDGTYKGGRCREDVYVYILTYRDGNGSTRVQKGHVTLLHAQ